MSSLPPLSLRNQPKFGAEPKPKLDLTGLQSAIEDHKAFLANLRHDRTAGTFSPLVEDTVSLSRHPNQGAESATLPTTSRKSRRNRDAANPSLLAQQAREVEALGAQRDTAKNELKDLGNEIKGLLISPPESGKPMLAPPLPPKTPISKKSMEEQGIQVIQGKDAISSLLSRGASASKENPVLPPVSSSPFQTATSAQFSQTSGTRLTRRQELIADFTQAALKTTPDRARRAAVRATDTPIENRRAISPSLEAIPTASNTDLVSGNKPTAPKSSKKQLKREAALRKKEESAAKRQLAQKPNLLQQAAELAILHEPAGATGMAMTIQNPHAESVRSAARKTPGKPLSKPNRRLRHALYNWETSLSENKHAAEARYDQAMQAVIKSERVPSDVGTYMMAGHGTQFPTTLKGLRARKNQSYSIPTSRESSPEPGARRPIKSSTAAAPRTPSTERAAKLNEDRKMYLVAKQMIALSRGPKYQALAPHQQIPTDMLPIYHDVVKNVERDGVYNPDSGTRQKLFNKKLADLQTAAQEAKGQLDTLTRYLRGHDSVGRARSQAQQNLENAIDQQEPAVDLIPKSKKQRRAISAVTRAIKDINDNGRTEAREQAMNAANQQVRTAFNLSEGQLFRITTTSG